MTALIKGSAPSAKARHLQPRSHLCLWTQGHSFRVDHCGSCSDFWSGSSAGHCEKFWRGVYQDLIAEGSMGAIYSHLVLQEEAASFQLSLGDLVLAAQHAVVIGTNLLPQLEPNLICRLRWRQCCFCNTITFNPAPPFRWQMPPFLQVCRFRGRLGQRGSGSKKASKFPSRQACVQSFFKHLS